jgi:hypothetical protein
MIVLGLSYQQRAHAYLGLVTEDWPPFTDESARSVEAPPSFGALPSTPPVAGSASEALSATTEPPATAAPPAEPAAPPPAPPEPPPAAPEPPTTPTDQPGEDDEPPRGPFGPSSGNP